MVTGTLKSYTDESIIELIEKLKNKEISYSLNDLKAVLAEVNNRHLDGNYAEVLGELIRDKILNGDTAAAPAPKKDETVVAPAVTEKDIKDEVKKPKKEKKEKVKSIQEKNQEKEETELYEDKYPVLSFAVGFLKVLGWIVMASSVCYGLYNAIAENLSTPAAAIGSIFTGLLIGTVTLLVCYINAENIALKLDIEEHLSQINKK